MLLRECSGRQRGLAAVGALSAVRGGAVLIFLMTAQTGVDGVLWQRRRRKGKLKQIVRK